MNGSIDPSRMAKICKSHAQFQQSIQLTSSDKSVFLKHGEITDRNLKFSLDFLRDFNNTLGLLTEQQHSERFERISQDTLDQICMIHNIQRDEIRKEWESYREEKRYKVNDINYSLQIMVVCELFLNNQPYEPDMKTGVISRYDLNQSIEFPIRICDLTPNTHISFTIYDLSRPQEKGPLAYTTIDLFDSKQRMRQGTFDLYLWKDVEKDKVHHTSFPGLFESNPEDVA